MRIVARLLVLLPLLWAEGVWAVDCPSEDYGLTSQAEVDALGATGCDRVSGYLYVNSFYGTAKDITNLDGLANITSVGGYLHINFNRALINLDGLANLTSVGGGLHINTNAALTNLNGLANITSVGGDLLIQGNPALTNLDGLASLTSVGGDLLIASSDAITNLDGLANLTSVRGMYISGNNALTNLNGLANITSVGGGLAIYDNYALTNLDGLANITSVGGVLAIYNNYALTDCQGIALVLGWPNGPPDDNVLGTIRIESNATGCNSVAQVLASFSPQSPTAPAVISTNYEDGRIILAVSVSNNGGAKITRYDATCTDGTNVFTGTSISSPITVSGLTNGVAYTCTVTATNSVGTSSASAATAPITPEEQVGGLPIWLLYQATQ